jgi:hypothetical protein
MGNQETKQVEPPKQIKPSELQTYIMVTQAKLTQARNKKVELIKKKVKEILETLTNNNLEIAKAKMEAVLREEDYITVYDILGPLCEILKEKVTYLLYSDKCPEDLRSPVDTIVYASTRLEIDELHKVRDLLRHKFGELFVTKGNSNSDQLVNRNVVEKLKVKPASESLLIARLKQLSQAEGISVDWPSEIEPITNTFEPNMNTPYNPYAVPGNNQQDIGGKDLSGMNLSGMNFSGQNFNQTGQTNNPHGGTNYNNLHFQNPYQTYNNQNQQVSTNTNFNQNQQVSTNTNFNQNQQINTNTNFNQNVNPYSGNVSGEGFYPTQSVIVDNNNFNKVDNTNYNKVDNTSYHNINQNSNNITPNSSSGTYSNDFNQHGSPYNNPYSGGSTNNVVNPYSGGSTNNVVNPYSGNPNTSTNVVNPYSGNVQPKTDDFNFPPVGGEFPKPGSGFP